MPAFHSLFPSDLLGGALDRSLDLTLGKGVNVIVNGCNVLKTC